MEDSISIVCENIKNQLIDFKKSDKKSIDVSVLEKVVDPYKARIPQDDIRLVPEYYGWTNNDECPPLEWISFMIYYYFSGNQLSLTSFLLILRTINYHGFFGLINVFGDDVLPKANPRKTDDNQMFYFSYFQYIAKYYRSLGNVDKAQEYYLKLMEVARDSGELAFAFSLLSKLNTDYLLRKGTAKEYSRISYEHAIKSKEFQEKHARHFLICLDTYAKDIYTSNPEEGEEVYTRLLELAQTYPLSLVRIEFRLLESRIKSKIEKNAFKDIPDLLKEYSQKIDTLLEKMPKAKYIRTLHFIGFFREIIIQANITDEWFNKKLKLLLDGEAEYLITSCISEARSFRDRRFIALGYYELSFWLVRNNRIDDAINYLKTGLDVFDIDKKSIINVIYTEIIKTLANLYGRKLQWEHSLFYYNQLYNYFMFITSELERQKKNLEFFLPGHSPEEVSASSEFVYLEDKERENMYQSLLIDYDTLVKVLLEYGNNINKIQSIDLHDIREAIRKQNLFISHEIRKHYNNLMAISKDLKKINVTTLKEPVLMEKLATLEREISGFGDNIDCYEKTAGVSLIETINLTDVANSYIEMFSRSYESDVIIKNLTRDHINVKFNPFHIKEYISILLCNAYIVGQRNDIKPIVIDFTLYQKSGIVYLECSDNCGDFENFEKNVINNLNSNNSTINSFNKDGHGLGLKMLKDLSVLYNIDSVWILKGNNKFKTLTIPLAKI